jgi:hypothetical protein
MVVVVVFVMMVMVVTMVVVAVAVASVAASPEARRSPVAICVDGYRNKTQREMNTH